MSLEYSDVDLSFATNKVHILIMSALKAGKIDKPRLEVAKCAVLLIEALLVPRMQLTPHRAFEMLQDAFKRMPPLAESEYLKCPECHSDNIARVAGMSGQLESNSDVYGVLICYDCQAPIELIKDAAGEWATRTPADLKK